MTSRRLATHFMDMAVKETKCPKARLTPAGIAALQNYDWPGNIRELRNVIERAMILASGVALEFDLPMTVPGAQIATTITAPGSNRSEPEFLTEPELRRREWENLLIALKKTGWRIKGANGAAELLGVKPTTLISRIKKMGVYRREVRRSNSPDNPLGMPPKTLPSLRERNPLVVRPSSLP